MKLINEPSVGNPIVDFGDRPYRSVYCWSQPDLDKFFNKLNTMIQDWPIYFYRKSIRNSISNWQIDRFNKSDAALIYIDKPTYNSLEYVELGLILGTFIRSFIYIDPEVVEDNKHIFDLISMPGYIFSTNLSKICEKFAIWSANQLVENKTIYSNISARSGVR